MSALIAVALRTLKEEFGDADRNAIFPCLNLPEIVKMNLDQSVKAYLNAIDLDGYDERIIRKMMVKGNRGTFPNFRQNINLTE